MAYPFIHKIKRILALITALVLVACLTGCKGKDDPDSTKDNQNPPVSDAGGSQTDPIDQPPETTVPPEDSTTAPEDTDAEVENRIGMVTATELRIRVKPGTQYDAIDFYVKGQRVEILEKQGDWGRTDKGWVHLDYITFDGVSQEPIEPEDEAEELVTDGNTEAKGYGVITTGAVNIRTGPGTKYQDIDDATLCERYPYFQKSGNWVRIEKGWISASYFYIEGTTGNGAGIGIIDGTDLTIRSGPGAGYEAKGTYNKNEKVNILAQVNGWGYTAKGWISMKYVKMDQQEQTPPADFEATGTITATTLNIRKEASEDAEKVGAYTKGDTVTILEIKDGWGRTDKGWVSMKYVELKSYPGIVTASSLFIRKEPKQDSEAIGYYEEGDVIKILDVKDGWGKTDKGWISLDYVKLAS